MAERRTASEEDVTTAALPDEPPLDNAVWASLTTHHALLAEVHGRARRFPVDVSPFCAVDSLDGGSWSDLAGLVEPGGTAVLFRDEINPAPDGWTTQFAGGGVQMVLPPGTDLPDPSGAPDPGTVRELDGSDVDAMLELVQLSRPGPFERGTHRLGRYVGIVEDGRLVAMAGERLRFPGVTEISAVCTHPDAQGRGLASFLTHVVAGGIVRRGERPILHVTHDNPARRVYERLGFRPRRDVAFAVLQAPSR